jgi:hypothetical protein
MKIMDQGYGFLPGVMQIWRHHLAKARQRSLPLPGEKVGVRAGSLNTNFAPRFMGRGKLALFYPVTLFLECTPFF